MTDRPNRPTIRVTDPKALRALAHPIRLSLMAVLRSQGPLTATRAGELLGESSASTSFHLRQLAKYGLVEEAGGGHGRERPWRATKLFTDIPETTRDPKVGAASALTRGVVAEYYFSLLRRWLAVRDDELEEWQRAALFGDTMIYVTAGELAELGRQYEELADQYVDRLTDPNRRPPGARLVSVLRLAQPYLFGPAGESEPGQPDAPGAPGATGPMP
jgi:DNA-binding transcriptional ArsR family regulator